MIPFGKRNKRRAKSRRQKKITGLIPIAGLALLVMTSFLAALYFIFLRTSPPFAKQPPENKVLPEATHQVAMPADSSSTSPPANQLADTAKKRVAIIINDTEYLEATGEALPDFAPDAPPQEAAPSGRGPASSPVRQLTDETKQRVAIVIKDMEYRRTTDEALMKSLSETSIRKTPPRSPDPASPLALQPTEEARPRIAIIIDDMGYRKITGEALLNLDLNLSFSFLPDAPNAQLQAEKARNLGRDVLLHLPLEPSDPTWKLGPGGLYTSMSKEEMRRVFAKDLAVVPMAIGVNNHMGSYFTENETAMRNLLEIIRDDHLFFLDSLTSSHSLGYETALIMGIKTGRRHIFLDNDHENGKVASQLLELISIAEKNGWAIGLAHPFPSTLLALREQKHLLRTRVEVVGISELIK
jgi:polysaccharide deacetylase 2 family uncharacterized protein YibQ